MTKWTLFLLPVLLQDAPARLRIYLDQKTPADVVRKALRVAQSSRIPYEAFVVVRDFSKLDTDLLTWKKTAFSRLRLADSGSLSDLGGCADRLPCFVLLRGGVRHRAHGIPRNMKEMTLCAKH